VTATASAGNIEYVPGLGATEVIDYRATPFEDKVQDVDVVFDTVGGGHPATLMETPEALRPGYHHCHIRGRHAG
jgi:NADPH:quinone reductase-like Zn-dependent oxidoreductase